MTFALDLSRRHFTHHRREITAIGAWLKQDGRMRPCLVLVRRGEEMAAGTVPCCVTLDKAWIWSEDVGDPRAAAHMALEFAEALRLGADKSAVFLVAGLIHDLLGDLVSMPPAPPDPVSAAPIAEVTVTDRRTGAAHEVVLTDG